VEKDVYLEGLYYIIYNKREEKRREEKRRSILRRALTSEIIYITM